MCSDIQVGSSRIDFLYEGRDALEVKTPLSPFPLERIGNPYLLHVSSPRRASTACASQPVKCDAQARSGRLSGYYKQLESVHALLLFVNIQWLQANVHEGNR